MGALEGLSFRVLRLLLLALMVLVVTQLPTH